MSKSWFWNEGHATSATAQSGIKLAAKKGTKTKNINAETNKAEYTS
jgi:hypothetical protein